MDCLVTKLKGSVNDPSLLKLGQTSFKVNCSTTSHFVLYTRGEVIISTKSGNTVLSDNSGMTNKVNRLSVDNFNDPFKYVYVNTNGATEEIIIDSYYNVRGFVFNDTNATIDASKLVSLIPYFNNPLYEITYIGKIPVELELFKDNPVQHNVGLSNAVGDIANLATSFRAYGDVAAAYIIGDIYGDINAFNGSLLRSLKMFNSLAINGNIGTLEMPEATELVIYGTSISGDIETFVSNCSKLAALDAGNVELTGDYFSALSSKSFRTLLCSGNFTYSSQSFSGKTYGRIGGSNFTCINLDGFLNAFQQATASSETKSIEMSGIRTSASDGAISTLQEKGFTVTVPSATDANSISTMSERINENYGIAYKDKELIVEPVDLTKMQIYPASGVTVKTFDTKENAEKFIEDNRFV